MGNEQVTKIQTEMEILNEKINSLDPILREVNESVAEKNVV